MTSDRGLQGALQSWLHEDRHEDATRILHTVLDGVGTTPQHRPRWSVGGMLAMNKFVAIGLGAAAVVAVLFIGAQLRITPTPGGPSETQSVTPSEAPSSVEPSSSGEGSLPEGPFALTTGGLVVGMDTLPITVTIPAPGWFGEVGWPLLTKHKNGNTDPPDGAALIAYFGDLEIYGDACQWSTTRPESPATTVEEMIAALAAQASRDASEPADVTLGGYAGQAITLHVPGDVDLLECDDATIGSWEIPGKGDSPNRYRQVPGEIDEVWIVDVDGTPVIIDWAYYAETPQTVVDELRAIVESITFGSE